MTISQIDFNVFILISEFVGDYKPRQPEYISSFKT